ncbi:MAG: hypothetical protein COB76_03750 [Alphaproteobacteria bacterium]|nr:MAG: hypothetical protein COB76_03750 [Alphaproteobacteria bacterium]
MDYQSMRHLFFIALLFLSIPANAQNTDVFTVNNIAVDVESDSAFSARNNALEKARRDAFNILTSRLLTQEERKDLPKAKSKHIATLVDSFEINREKYSKNRYLASLNITFNPRAVHGYLGRYTNVALPDLFSHGANTPSKTASDSTQSTMKITRLILPWYGKESAITLWRDPNPWRDAWASWARTQRAQDLNIIVPIGDINDMQAFNPQKPLSFDQDALQRLLNRYNADQAIIAMADPLPNGMIRVSLYQSTSMTPRFIDRVIASGGSMRGMNRFLPAIYQSAEKIESAATKAYSIAAAKQSVTDTPSFAVDNTITTAFEAEVKIANIQQWIGIKQSLSLVSGVNNVQVKSLSPGRAVIAFRYAGTPEALRRDLSRRGLSLYANPTQMSGASPYIIVRKNG